MTDPLGRFRALVDSEHPEAVIAFVQHLSRLRSAAIVGRALAERSPDETSWQELLCSREFLELVDEVVGFAVDVTTTMQHLGDLADPEAIQEAVDQEYPRALAAVDDLAKVLNVPGEDLLSILMEA